MRLAASLAAVRASTRQPHVIVVSDDSTQEDERQRTRQVAEAHRADYVIGPRRGVCANRNNCLAHVGEATHIQFLDDDCEEPADFIANAERRYAKMSDENARRMILVGREIYDDGTESWKYRMTFRGFYAPSATAEIPSCKATVYPIEAFRRTRWNENIFYGLEDAELAFQVKASGFAFEARADLFVRDLGRGASSLNDRGGGRVLLAYVSAARMHVGLKRYLVYRRRPELAVLFFVYANLAIARESARLRSLSYFFEVYSKANLYRVLQKRGQ